MEKLIEHKTQSDNFQHSRKYFSTKPGSIQCCEDKFNRLQRIFEIQFMFAFARFNEM